MATTPGFAQQAQYRNTFRVLGVIVLIAGILIFIWGLTQVMGSGTEPGGLMIAAFIGGLPTIGVGLMLLQWGFLGAAARYGAGETMPVVKDSATYLSDGEGILGVGRTAGPFCSKCGTRNDEGAKFCDSCGAAIA